MKRILLAALFAFPTPTLADNKKAIDTSFFLLTHTYAQLRIVSANCNLGSGEWIAARRRILTALLEYPQVDLLRAEREMDRYYEQEKGRMGATCSDAQREIYQMGIDSIDRDIDYLRSLIFKAR